jgi:hypothetical protein
MTHYQKIQGMDVDELAGFLDDVTDDCTNACIGCKYVFKDFARQKCKKSIAEWLESEVVTWDE